MSEIVIEKCTEKHLHYYTKIMVQAFNDKYPHFFSKISEKEYSEILRQLNLLELQSNNFNGKYVIVYNGNIAGAINFYICRQKVPFSQYYKILGKNIGFLKAIKVGIMLLGFGPPFNFPRDTLYIDQIGISVDFRRKGLGKKLMNFAIEKAMKIRCKNVKLDVIAKNEGAIALYNNLGFTITKTNETKLGEVFLGIRKYYTMEKKLS
ncbi:MAG: GNAT family N-acetyltransferase [Candidatus Heimdallarchaeota archaeon]